MSGCSYQYNFSGCYNCHQRHLSEVRSLQAASFRAEATHQAEISRITAESSLALTNKNAKYELLLSEIKMLKAEIDSQRSEMRFLKLHPEPPYKSQMVEAVRVLGIPPADYPDFFVLAAKSQTVQNWLYGGQAGLDQINKLWLSETPVFKEIVNFCNSGDFTFSELVRAEEVLPLADKLEIRFLKELCEAELRRRLTVDNVPDMLKLARRFAATELEKEAEKRFREHFDIVKTKFFDVLETLDDGWERAKEDELD